MDNPYLYMLLGLASFAAMGIIHKLGDRFLCDSLLIAAVAMSVASLVSALNVIVLEKKSLAGVPPNVILIAVPFGISAALGLWLFQRGLRYGRISTSWLLINLSAAIPTVLSIIVYKEPLSLRRTLVLLMIVGSLLLLWWDRQKDRMKEAQALSRESALQTKRVWR